MRWTRKRRHFIPRPMVGAERSSQHRPVTPRVAASFKASILSLCMGLQAGASASLAQAQSGFNLSRPAPGVFLHTGRQLALDVPGHDDIANIGFVVGEKCVAVIDTGGSVGIGRALRAARQTYLLADLLRDQYPCACG